MSLLQLPEFDHTLALAQGNLNAGELAECHGVACGLLVRYPQSGPDAFLLLLTTLEILAEPGVALREALVELHHATGRQLADEEMRLALWLPDDDEPLEDRTAALAQWCKGFLAGLGSGQDGRLETLSQEAGEALADLQQITRAEIGETAGNSPQDKDEEERAFMEIVEYTRVVALMLHEDLRGPETSDSIH